MAITYQRIPSTDPRLGRHIRHDDRSRLYPFNTTGLTIISVKHFCHIPVLDQGRIGSCTGNAGIRCLATDPFYLITPPSVKHPIGLEVSDIFTLDEQGAIALYSEATKLDDYPGVYPPDDTGSDGLSVAKALKNAGEISGYQHTFTFEDTLKVLSVMPVIMGMYWYNGMFTPDQDGRVHPTGGIAGGHEICADEIDADLGRVWFTNSWGSSWGLNGRFYLSFDDLELLLSQDGDVTIFIPLTDPPPPPVDPDAILALAFAHNNWINKRHVGDNAYVAKAAKTWLKATGR